MDVISETMPKKYQVGGIIFYATGALGQFRPFVDLCNQAFIKLSWIWETYHMALTGKLFSVAYMKRLFFLPDTTCTTGTSALDEDPIAMDEFQ